MKKIVEVLKSRGDHWVGDGFPVRSLFSYQGDTDAISPFLLFDYAGPFQFAPAQIPRGVGEHPHRGFETVTIVYDGEVSHRDSMGGGGTIGKGDVQWMTAGSGVVHDEFHSQKFTESGGRFQIVQLWVNLPAKAKMTKPAYQAIISAEIPTVDLAQGQGHARVIAGDMNGVKGPASTFSPLNLWDVKLDRGAKITLDLPDGHNSMIAILTGGITILQAPEGLEGPISVGEAEIARFERQGRQVTLFADTDARLLVMSGEPIDEPVVGAGPFVMNSREEIRQAYADYKSGQFGHVA